MSLDFQHETLRSEIVRLLNQYECVDAFHKEHEEMGEAVHSRNLRKIYNKISDILDENHKQYPKDIEKYRKQNIDKPSKCPIEQNTASDNSSACFIEFDDSFDNKNTLIIGGKETGKTTLVHKIIKNIKNETSLPSITIWVSNKGQKINNIPKDCFISPVDIFVEYDNSLDSKMFDIIEIQINKHYKENCRIYVVFDDIIYNNEEIDSLVGYIRLLGFKSKNIYGFLTIPYAFSDITNYKNAFKYIIAFKETQYDNQKKLYELLNSTLINENIFDAFKYTMNYELNDYKCMVRNNQTDSLSFIETKDRPLNFRSINYKAYYNKQPRILTNNEYDAIKEYIESKGLPNEVTFLNCTIGDPVEKK